MTTLFRHSGHKWTIWSSFEKNLALGRGRHPFSTRELESTFGSNRQNRKFGAASGPIWSGALELGNWFQRPTESHPILNCIGQHLLLHVDHYWGASHPFSNPRACTTREIIKSAQYILIFKQIFRQFERYTMLPFVYHEYCLVNGIEMTFRDSAY